MVYDYTYNPKSRILVSNLTNEKWDLTECEHIFLMPLIEKEFVQKEELLDLLSKTSRNFNIVSLTKSRLCIKTGIKIKTKVNMGFRLISTIELKENYLREVQ